MERALALASVDAAATRFPGALHAADRRSPARCRRAEEFEGMRELSASSASTQSPRRRFNAPCIARCDARTQNESARRSDAEEWRRVDRYHARDNVCERTPSQICRLAELGVHAHPPRRHRTVRVLPAPRLSRYCCGPVIVSHVLRSAPRSPRAQTRPLGQRATELSGSAGPRGNHGSRLPFTPGC